MVLPRVTDAERRSRIARRHALAPSRRVATPEAATRAMTVLHATEAATVHLAVAARTEGVGLSEVDAALYDDRNLVKQLAMRRTLFVFPRDLLPAAWGSASARVAGAEARRVAKAVVAAGLTDDGARWLEAACAAVLERLAEGPATTTRLRDDVPEIGGSIEAAPGRRWGGRVNVATWVLTQLGLRGEVVRGHNGGHWRTSRPTWTRTVDWLGEVPAPLEEAAGYAEIVRRWLQTFGPGTEDDVVWWLGATRTAVRRALADVEAVEVALDDGTTGWVLPGDEGAGLAGPRSGRDGQDRDWGALLPALDPTTMGWRRRDFYLDPAHTPYLFDTNGNAGTTAWWGGRIVGCWVQDEAGSVRVSLLEDVGAAGRAALDAEADRLTAWLAGVRVATIYTSPAMKRALQG